jgi:hypothetical protein
MKLLSSRNLRQAGLIGMLAITMGWLGLWAPWIPDANASMRQNVFDLAAWSAFLLDVRAGPLAATPDILRLGIALASLALALGASDLENRWLRWGVRLGVALPGLMLLPPYPFVLLLWHAEGYELRFLITIGLWVGIASCFLFDRLPRGIRYGLTALIAGAALTISIGAFLKLRPPFEAHYTHPLVPGWGLLIYAAGLLFAVIFQAAAAAGEFIHHRAPQGG